MIVDGKNTRGVRTSVSVDDKLFMLFCIKLNSKKKARKWVRDLMKSQPIVTSADVRFKMYDQIADAELVKKFERAMGGSETLGEWESQLD